MLFNLPPNSVGTHLITGRQVKTLNVNPPVDRGRDTGFRQRLSRKGRRFTGIRYFSLLVPPILIQISSSVIRHSCSSPQGGDFIHSRICVPVTGVVPIESPETPRTTQTPTSLRLLPSTQHDVETATLVFLVTVDVVYWTLR